MSYLVTCSFDLKDASATDYQDAYSDLARIGLRRTVVVDGGRHIVVPTTMTVGEFDGASAEAIRDDVRHQVRAAFEARRFSSEIFITVGGADWTWGGVRSE